MTTCTHIPDNINLAFKLATRYSLPGADNLFVDQFNKSLISNDFTTAAKLASSAPGTLLRNMDTINRFKSLQPNPGQP